MSMNESQNSYSLYRHELYKQDCLVMLEDEDLSDVCFRVGNEQSGIKDIHGIRALFAGHSSVLKSMLFGNMLESQRNNLVEITDVSPNTFEWFKKFCYGLNTSITSNNIAGILHICDKYCMEKLMNISLNEYLIEIMPNDEMKSLVTVLVELNQKNMDNVVYSILNSEQFGNLTNPQRTSVLSEIVSWNWKPNGLIAAPKLVTNILFHSRIKFIALCGQERMFTLLKHYCTVLIKSKSQKAGDPDICPDKDHYDEQNYESKMQSARCKDESTDIHIDNDSEDSKEPPNKRRRLMNDRSTESGSMDLTDNTEKNEKKTEDETEKQKIKEEVTDDSQEWATTMKQYFCKYFDFFSIDVKFFFEHIYCVENLLSQSKKLSILAKKVKKHCDLPISDDGQVQKKDVFDRRPGQVWTTTLLHSASAETSNNAAASASVSENEAPDDDNTTYLDIDNNSDTVNIVSDGVSSWSNLEKNKFDVTFVHIGGLKLAHGWCFPNHDNIHDIDNNFKLSDSYDTKYDENKHGLNVNLNENKSFEHVSKLLNDKENFQKDHWMIFELHPYSKQDCQPYGDFCNYLKDYEEVAVSVLTHDIHEKVSLYLLPPDETIMNEQELKKTFDGIVVPGGVMWAFVYIEHLTQRDRVQQ